MIARIAEEDSLQLLAGQWSSLKPLRPFLGAFNEG
jgi:hypothetical protein